MMKKMLVLGGGESGVGAAVLASMNGYKVFLSDNGIIKDKYKSILTRYPILWEEGGHSEEFLSDVSLVVKSPGIPFNIPIVQSFIKDGIDVIDEIEFASRYTNATLICITGSNGKTTTSMLTHHILSKGGKKVGLAGNIGRSLAYQVATMDFDTYVIELSSFQLDGMTSFRADFAAIMNITPDHLDRYEYSLEKYANSKFRITRNMRRSNLFLYCADDELSRRFVSEIESSPRIKSFGLSSSADFTVEYDTKVLKMPLSKLSLKGRHNQYNCMVAATAAMYMNIDEKYIKEGLADFTPVEHRLEPVAVIDGVQYINDSKATNVDSCWYALDSIENSIVWIVGGKDKGNDYSALDSLVKNKVKAIVCLGVDNVKLRKAFSSIVDKIEEASSAKEAVKKANFMAAEGDVVLLSPCCASFDLFKSYEDRGEQYKRAVINLKDSTNGKIC